MNRLLFRFCTLATIVGFALVGDWLGAAGADHAYFDALVSRGEHWKSYSFRDHAQLRDIPSGGYATAKETDRGLWVTYNPGADTDPHRQDAAKVVIAAYGRSAGGFSTLASPMDQATTTVYPSSALATSPLGSLMSTQRTLKIDNEMMKIVSWNAAARSVVVTRGSNGTTPAPHNAGAPVLGSNNNLENQVRVPLGTSDGHTYLFTWDAYWTDSYVGPAAAIFGGHKTFQFSSGRDQIWLEPSTAYNGGSRFIETPGMFNAATDVATVSIRSYNLEGKEADWTKTNGNYLPPGVKSYPLGPRTETPTFVIKPNTWTRFWLRVEQRANEWDYIDYWVADERVGPTQIHRRTPVSVRAGGIEKFWLEFNTSLDYYRGTERDLVAYVRNFVALQDVAAGNVAGLLLRPLPGIAPQAGPAPPGNLRVLTQ